MQRKNLFQGMAVLAIAVVSVVVACTKSETSQQNVPPAGKQAVSLYLTDDPGFFDHVYVDIKSVQVLVDTCAKDSSSNGWAWGNRDSCRTWEDLQIRAGVYDILSFRNGLDTLFAQGNVSVGKIRAIKISLGTQNSLVKDSVTYPLNLPADLNSTIVLSLRGDEWDVFASGRCRLWLDFDIGRSIVRVWNGTFYLRPIFHWFIVKTTGGVQGKVLPRDAYPVISVYSGADTSYALPTGSGQFAVRGLASGTYSVYINASNGYKDTTITNVTVEAGKQTQLGNITLHK
jgi:hypothetical protein